MPTWKTIEPEKWKDNVFEAVGKDCMLITAGTATELNTMTAAWGGMGVMWHKPVVWVVIRPNRHTFLYMEENKRFSLCFFDKKDRHILNYCGSHSGRDVDKVTECGLTAAVNGDSAPYFEEARQVILCWKLYYQDIDPEHFLDASLDKNYPGKQYHRMYVGEIESILQKA